MAEALLLLICFHLLLFRRFYFQNSFLYACSECLEQGFASSRLLGEHLRQHGFFNLQPVNDPYFYPDYSALPFLSTYYWPHRLQAWLGAWLSLNRAFQLYSLTMVWHFLLSGIGCLFLLHRIGMEWLPAIFGAVTLSSLGYAMKQNSCISYTCAWVPLLLLAAPQHSMGLFGISLGMMLTAGYWPIALPGGVLGCWLWLLA